MVIIDLEKLLGIFAPKGKVGWDPVRHILRDVCPLCKQSMDRHRYAWLAGYRFDADLQNRHEGRIRLTRDGMREFPWPSMDDYDSLYYYLLLCPVKCESVVLEHVSGQDLYSEESVAPFDVAADIRAKFAERAMKWTSLNDNQIQTPISSSL
ncbi:MAG: hypothetical protein R3E58_13620 [Phycisphaerae bacterium]